MDMVLLLLLTEVILSPFFRGSGSGFHGLVILRGSPVVAAAVVVVPSTLLLVKVVLLLVVVILAFTGLSSFFPWSLGSR